jgi:1-deoxy-D-xylulose-5-phosphate synthase
MYTAQLPGGGPFSIRYPRGRGSMPDWKKELRELPVGKGKQVREGKDIALVCIGPVGAFARTAAEILEKEGISAAVYNMIFLKPLDEELLHEVFKIHQKVITVEDGTILGGLGSAVIEFANDHGYSARINRLGIPDRFVEQGSPEELYAECGYDSPGIVKAVKDMLQN